MSGIFGNASDATIRNLVWNSSSLLEKVKEESIKIMAEKG